MPAYNAKQIIDELIINNQLTEEQKLLYQSIAEKNPELLETALQKDNAISKEALAQAKGKVLNLPYINLEDRAIDLAILKILPQDLSANYKMLIFDKRGNVLRVGMVNPGDYKAVEAIEFLARKRGYKAEYYIISQAGFKSSFKNYESIKEQVGEALGYAEEKFAPAEIGKTLEEATTLEEVVKSAPVSKIVSVILRHAIEGRASDIHIEPQGDKSKIRYRIDGILHTSIVLPIYVHAALVSRIKVISNLKIDETRTPQDGRIRLNVAGRDVDFRVSIIPLVNQEKVVMRILESPDKAPTFEELGFMGRQLELMTKNLREPNGMFLVTGPTGSGKSTTLFSALSSLNKEGVNISTLEDPVEYYIKGINQSQVRPDVGFTFATGLRALLRQDPDIIMVGEIRDQETVELAIHAALTGHFVLSTLHTNDAVGAIPRFIDMGAQPFLLASTLNLIVAQRLIRKICDHCKIKEEIKGDVLKEIEENLTALPEKSFYPGLKKDSAPVVYKGKGCAKCGNTGYQGRISISEVLPISQRMKEIIYHGFKSEEVKEELKKQEFITLTQDGWMKALLGLTTIEEILRVTKTE
ncbi:Flp pilus assembly complex ATPase component TadA [Patescibacteria group bacterium]|nr:Flp pilus assembly complex ATPase component TadA [Patescibacteria group bacterium]